MEYGGILVDSFTIVASLFMLETNSVFLRFIINVKLVSYLGMIGVNYGDVLDDFLIRIGKQFFPKNKLGADTLTMIPNRYYSKFSDHSVSLTLLNHQYLKISLYSVSWLINVVLLLANFFKKFEERPKHHNKWFFYFRLFQRRIHFALIQVVTNSVVILSTRSILHLRMGFENFVSSIFIDKLFSVLILFAYSIDLMLVVQTCLDHLFHKDLIQRKFLNTEKEVEKIAEFKANIDVF